MFNNNTPRSIVVPAGARDRGNLDVTGIIQFPNYGLEMEPEDAGVPVSHYLWILRRHCWKLLTFVVITVIATLAISNRLTPIYESTATIDIDRQIPSGIIGEDAHQTALSDPDQFLATQVKLIQADSVLRPVADRYRLREGEREFGGAQPDDSTRSTEAPVLLKNLKVTRPPNTYLLLVSYRSTDPKLAADVANAVARSYLEHTYRIRFESTANLSSFMEKQLEELRAKMERSGAALAQFEKELNVINPEEKTSILSARLLHLNTEYTNAETERVRKETAFKSVSTGTLEAAEVSSQGESLRKISDRLDEAQQRLAIVRSHYGENHPEYKKAAAQLLAIQLQLQQHKENIAKRVAVEYKDALNRETMLKKVVAETKGEFDRINARSFQYQALKHEAEADRKLYEELVLKIKQAGINAGFQNSSIRIADSARPSAKPVFPNLKLNLLLAFMFSVLFGVGAALLADMLDKTVRDPDQVWRTLRTEVVGSLPHVKEIGRLASVADSVRNGITGALVPADKPKPNRQLTGYAEAVRTLRNSILLADFDSRLNSLMVASAAPSEGKSTIATNLAIAHAQHRRKTLLIDGDLRRSTLHRRFGLSGAIGLSNVLNATVPWRAALAHPAAVPNLDILPAGPPSRDGCDQIGTGLMQILEEARNEYDLIVLDSPPLLGSPESLQLATSVDGVLVVARSGQTNRKALGLAIGTLNRLRANVIGVVMNEMRANANEGYHYGYHYGYHSS